MRAHTFTYSKRGRNNYIRVISRPRHTYFDTTHQRHIMFVGKRERRQRRLEKRAYKTQKNGNTVAMTRIV